jgi:hypothetical protein
MNIYYAKWLTIALVVMVAIFTWSVIDYPQDSEHSPCPHCGAHRVRHTLVQVGQDNKCRILFYRCPDCSEAWTEASCQEQLHWRTVRAGRTPQLGGSSSPTNERPPDKHSGNIEHGRLLIPKQTTPLLCLRHAVFMHVQWLPCTAWYALGLYSLPHHP